MDLHGESRPHPLASLQPRISLNVLFGVPDDGKEVVRVAEGGRALTASEVAAGQRSFKLRGSANIAPYLSAERFALNRLYLQATDQTQIRLGPGAILNHIADPDICSRALTMVASITRQVRRPCFNHPRA